jgi:hypothetical protein
MELLISGNYTLPVLDRFKYLYGKNLYLQCDTSESPVNIVLPRISNIPHYDGVSIFINDLSENSGTNNITVICHEADKINGGENVVISQSGTGVCVRIVGKNDYKATGSGIGGGGSASALPYLVYAAFLTQSGTDAPVATIIENTLNIQANWTRVNTGYYRLVTGLDLPYNKTRIIPPESTIEPFVNSSNFPVFAVGTLQGGKTGNNFEIINLSTGFRDGSTGIITRVDDVINNQVGRAMVSIEIRLYE